MPKALQCPGLSPARSRKACRSLAADVQAVAACFGGHRISRAQPAGLLRPIRPTAWRPEPGRNTISAHRTAPCSLLAGRRYYQTLRYGTIDDTGNAAVVGWGAAGLSTFRWTGSGWTPLGVTPVFGDAAAHPASVISARIAKVDTTSIENLLVLSVRDTPFQEQGLWVYRFVSGTRLADDR